MFHNALFRQSLRLIIGDFGNVKRAEEVIVPSYPDELTCSNGAVEQASRDAILKVYFAASGVN
jgi:hypothetical protein